MSDILKYSDALEKQKRVRCFMDGIDWQEHLGRDPNGSALYPSAESTKREESCLRQGGGCGIVEVEVRLVRWVVPQDLRGEINAAPDAGLASGADITPAAPVAAPDGDDR